MVLSNKKLKRKLRTDLTSSLADSEAQTNTTTITKPDSLKSLLVSAAPKPRLSKREKRRQKPISQPKLNTKTEHEQSVDDPNTNITKKKKKKRKRDGEIKENGGSGNIEAKKPNKSKKKKNKKAKKAEVVVEKVNKHKESVVEQQCVPEIAKTTDRQENVDVSTKVYVGGIPYYSTEDDIRSFFESCGSIVEIDCMIFPDSGKFRGIAIISFKTEAAAKRALELDGADMGGLFLKIQLYKATRVSSKPSDFSPAIIEGYNKIYIGNLSWDITEDDVKKLLSDCNISSIRFGEDKETGEFRGYGHVNFADSLSVTMALKLDQTILCGRPVRIRCAVPKKSSDPNSKSEPAREKVDNGGLYSNPKSEPTTKKVNNGELYSNSKSEATNEKTDDGGLNSYYLKYEKSDNGVLKSYSKHEATNEKADNGVHYSYPKYVATNEKADNVAVYSKSDPASEKVDTGAVVSGKIRRRTCYVCGEKGHLSSACPKSEKAYEKSDNEVLKSYSKYEATNEKADNGENYSYLKYAATNEKADNVTVFSKADTTSEKADNAVVSGKIRRRTCYVCGEKGHLSSSCPKKPSC